MSRVLRAFYAEWDLYETALAHHTIKGNYMLVGSTWLRSSSVQCVNIYTSSVLTTERRGGGGTERKKQRKFAGRRKPRREDTNRETKEGRREGENVEKNRGTKRQAKKNSCG